jgi:hypothetical protein
MKEYNIFIGGPLRNRKQRKKAKMQTRKAINQAKKEGRYMLDKDRNDCIFVRTGEYTETIGRATQVSLYE